MLLVPNSIHLPDEKQSLQSLRRLQKAHLVELDSDEIKIQIEHGQEGDMIRYWTKGKYSTHNLIALCAERLGPCDLYFSTWALSMPAVERIFAMRSVNQIRRVVALLDFRTKANAPEAVQLLEGMADKITFKRSHAKCYVLRNEREGCSIITSSNLTTNRRIEGGVILFCNETAKEDANFVEDG